MMLCTGSNSDKYLQSEEESVIIRYRWNAQFYPFFVQNSRNNLHPARGRIQLQGRPGAHVHRETIYTPQGDEYPMLSRNSSS